MRHVAYKSKCRLHSCTSVYSKSKTVGVTNLDALTGEILHHLFGWITWPWTQRFNLRKIRFPIKTVALFVVSIPAIAEMIHECMFSSKWGEFVFNLWYCINPLTNWTIHVIDGAKGNRMTSVLLLLLAVSVMRLLHAYYLMYGSVKSSAP